MNLTQQSRHQMQHLIPQTIALKMGLSFPNRVSCFLAKYSKTTLIIVTTAMRKAPKAMDPRWYMKAHFTPREILTAPLDFESSLPSPEKYHMQVTAAVINC